MRAWRSSWNRVAALDADRAATELDYFEISSSVQMSLSSLAIVK